MRNLKKKRQIIRRAALLCTLALILAGPAACGYQFSGGGELRGGIERLSISFFKNQTGETGIEAIVTNDIVNQFTRYETVQLVDKASAEAILSGVIRSAQIRTISHTSPNQAAERRITLHLEVRLETADGRLIWSTRDISASDSYDVAPEKRRTEQNKKSALASASQRLAERIYYRLTDEF